VSSWGAEVRFLRLLGAMMMTWDEMERREEWASE
jgi:hypothetical protein